MASGTSAHDDTVSTHAAAGIALAILTLINLFNYLDRYLVSALAQSLKTSTLALTDFELGLLMTGFLVVYMLAAPVFGAMGDSRPRPRLIAMGIACWSLATGLSGAVNSFLALLVARAAVGVGEAAYGTIAPGLLADYYRRSQRARIMAVFFCAIPVGSALGYIVGGWVDKHFGWRMAFVLAGFPGLALAAIAWFLPDPPRGGTEKLQAGAGMMAHGAQFWQRLRHITSRNSYNLTVLGYAAYTFAVGALGFWMPSFLERARGMPRIEATVSFGAIVAACGFVGTLAGGWLGDYLARYSRQAFLWLSAGATLLAAPLVWIALTTQSNSVYWFTMVGAQLCLWLSAGPVNATILNLSAPAERATAFALSILTIHLLGDVISPPLIGLLSDLSSLDQAIQIVPFAILIAALLWMLGARSQRQEHLSGAAPA
jgi:MFS transporter, Spinster family, sphingosine-1-phosphate transporter